MSLRDTLLALLLIGALPVALRRPFFGAMVYAWLGLMNPHRLTWGFARDIGWAQAYAIATLLGVVISQNGLFQDSLKRYKWIAFYFAWMCVTTIFAGDFATAYARLMDVAKILLMGLVTLSVLRTHRQIEILVTVATLSIAFYGIKGGYFTITGGGTNRVYGPSGSVIEDNNQLAAALTMTVPLMLWLFQRAQDRWIKIAITGAILLTFASIAGSHSRGAFLSLGCIALALIFKSKHKLPALILVGGGVFAAFAVMPNYYWDRMQSITAYETDASSQGRINVWKGAFNIANSRITGAGFDYYGGSLFAQYAPNADDVHSSHSIYFQSLGEHGWIGFILFLIIWISAWRQCTAIRRSLPVAEQRGATAQLTSMIQVSLIGFASGGAFVNIGYWDYPYYLAVIVYALNRATGNYARSPVGRKARMSHREEQPITSLPASRQEVT